MILQRGARPKTPFFGLVHPYSAPPSRRAATAVEFAVVAPVFFLFVLGFIELGRGYMVQHLMTNAARQGCRGDRKPTLFEQTRQFLNRASDPLLSNVFVGAESFTNRH